jgi:hypothetical protein
MGTRLIVALTFLPLLIACGGPGDRNGDNAPENILHLRDFDISEADFERGLSEDIGEDRVAKSILCEVAYLSQDEFVSAIKFHVVFGDGVVEHNPAAIPYMKREPFPSETPVPGQRADRVSQERVYAILKEMCEG